MANFLLITQSSSRDGVIFAVFAVFDDEKTFFGHGIQQLFIFNALSLWFRLNPTSLCMSYVSVTINWFAIQ